MPGIKAKKRPGNIRVFSKIKICLLLAAAAKLVLELLDPASGIDESLFTSVNRMGIHGDITNHNHVFNSINGFGAVRLDGRTSEEILAGGNVAKTHRICFGMNISFHSGPCLRELTLTRFEAGVGFANYVDATPTTDDLTVGMAIFQRLDGRNDFHDKISLRKTEDKSLPRLSCQLIKPIETNFFKTVHSLNCDCETNRTPRSNPAKNGAAPEFTTPWLDLRMIGCRASISRLPEPRRWQSPDPLRHIEYHANC